MKDNESKENKTSQDHKDNRTTSNVIIFPDFQELKDDVEKLRTEFSMLLLERDELEFVICKNIETEYMLQLGTLEYKAYEAECMALRLKRKVELIQAKQNRQEKVILSKIEERLELEFAKYQEELDAQIEKMNEALEHNQLETLSAEDNKELKKLYRKIVKEIHPDINPEVTEAQFKMFANAVSAYKNGDLETLRIINEMVGEHTLPEKSKDAMEQLLDEKKRLESLLKIIQDKIVAIKSEYPYIAKEIIEDPEKIARKQDELENILLQYNEIIENYKNKIEQMLR